MSTGRSNRPLFDMLDSARTKPRGSEARGSAPVSSGGTHIEPKPMIRVKPVAAPAAPERSSSPSPKIGMLGALKLKLRPFLGEATMTVPANALYYGTAGVVLLIVVAWVVGYRAGGAKEYQKLEPHLRSEPIRISEPGSSRSQTPGVANPAGNAGSKSAAPGAGGAIADLGASRPEPQPSTPAPSGQAARPSAQPGSESIAPAPSGTPLTEIEVSSTAGPTSAADVFTARGWASRDPREPGLNYLFLPVMHRPEAERAVKFLAANSLEAIAIPLKVDRRGAKANNPPPEDALYRVVPRRGFSGTELRDDAPEKMNLQAAVQRLGQVWKRDHRGTTDFSSVSWEKLPEAR